MNNILITLVWSQLFQNTPSSGQNFLFVQNFVLWTNAHTTNDIAISLECTLCLVLKPAKTVHWDGKQGRKKKHAKHQQHVSIGIVSMLAYSMLAQPDRAISIAVDS